MAKFESSEHFNQQQKLVLRLATALTRIPTDVTDALFKDLRDQFSDRQIVELTAAIAWENFRARFNRTFNVASENFSKGQVCPLPER